MLDTPAPSRPRAPRTTAPGHVMRVLLLLMFATLAVATLVTGARPASLGELRAALGSGRVTAVHIVDALPVGATGFSQARVEWRDGLQHRYTLVRNVAGDEQPAPGSMARGEEVRGDIAAELRLSQPGLAVTASDSQAESSGLVFDWRVPLWVTFAALTWWLMVVSLLVSGSEPRHATRWAWFWLFLSGFGIPAMVAYLVVGVPRWQDPFAPTARRLTGGWAFLMMLLLPRPV